MAFYFTILPILWCRQFLTTLAVTRPGVNTIQRPNRLPVANNRVAAFALPAAWENTHGWFPAGMSDWSL